MRELGALLLTVVAIVGLYVLGFFGHHQIRPLAACSSATIGTVRCPGTTSATGTLPAAHHGR